MKRCKNCGKPLRRKKALTICVDCMTEKPSEELSEIEKIEAELNLYGN